MYRLAPSTKRTAERHDHENRRNISAKNESGENAYLWLQSAAGDCILWPTEDASENEDSADAIGRWQLTVDEANALIETGEVDEVE